MSSVRQFVASFKEAEARDRKFIGELDIQLLNNMLWPLYIAFICMNFLDVYSTLLALNAGAHFRELNPIAAILFGLQFHGFLVATAFKYLPAIPLFYVVFARASSSAHAFDIRLVKFAALVALVASDILLLYVVGLNNIPQLARMVISRL